MFPATIATFNLLYCELDFPMSFILTSTKSPCCLCLHDYISYLPHPSNTFTNKATSLLLLPQNMHVPLLSGRCIQAVVLRLCSTLYMRQATRRYITQALIHCVNTLFLICPLHVCVNIKVESEMRVSLFKET